MRVPGAGVVQWCSMCLLNANLSHDPFKSLIGGHPCNHCCFLYYFYSYNFYLLRNLVTGSVSLFLPCLKDRPKIQFGNERGGLAGNIGFIH